MFEPFSLDSMYYHHRQKIEDFINALAATANPNDHQAQESASRVSGLKLNHLTSDEIKYIEKEVANRWGK